jgi:23S rRNA (cytidine1920-2'-O)/16S rRNA (cytidine1409-2'-O)-methyltransferase
MARRRLDAELVRRGLAASREQAQSAIAAGRVSVSGVVAGKSATQVDVAAAIEVDRAGSDYVSRGAHKLIGALDAFDVDVAGFLALDAGASTGGFTQVLLERGAQAVAAVDVGYGQLAWSLRSDDRVQVFERTNVRHLAAGDLPFAPDLVVADLSFISLTKVLPALVAVAAPEAQWIVMVKPQFEAGRAKVKAGVVSDPQVRIESVQAVVQAGWDLGLAVQGVAASPLPGPKGNVEYFLWMTRSGGDDGREGRDDGGMDEQTTAEAIARAVREGPT